MFSIKFNPRNTVLLLLILATSMLRVALHFNTDFALLSNFSPLGAIALFGGAYFNQRSKAVGFPLLSLLASDIILQQTLYSKYSNGLLYGGWYWVYGAFVLMPLVGRMLIKRATVLSVMLAAFAVTCVHWIVTDLGVWLGSSVYPQTAAGFAACLAAAVPFEINFLAGTMLYAALLFCTFAWIVQKNKQLQVTRIV